MSPAESPIWLATSRIIDWQHPAVLAQAHDLAAGQDGDAAIAAACFHFVRDEIRHSWDYRLNPVTCAASAVLEHRTGYCYAKSHLLAALLRANGIPAGLCYQRLSIADDRPPYCLHGLNAVYLAEYGWYRIDARGNKPGVDAQFTPPVERLAYAAHLPGEVDLPGIYAAPLAPVVEALATAADYRELAERLPDLAPPVARPTLSGRPVGGPAASAAGPGSVCRD